MFCDFLNLNFSMQVYSIIFMNAKLFPDLFFRKIQIINLYIIRPKIRCQLFIIS